MASQADLLPVLGVPTSHLIPLGVLASYLVIVVVLLKLALDAVDEGTPAPTSLLDATRRRTRWSTIFKLIAAGSLLHTWTHMLRYMAWSCGNFAQSAVVEPSMSTLHTVGTWLLETSLFEEAWAIVLRPGTSAWISEHITTYTISYWVLLLWVYTRPAGSAGSVLRGWSSAQAALFLLLGQLVAISVASALFFAGCAQRSISQVDNTKLRVPLAVWASLLFSASLSALVPLTQDQPTFLPNLLLFHLVLFVPFLPLAQRPSLSLSVRTTSLLLCVPLVPALLLHAPPSASSIWAAYWDGNDALRSIGADALWVLVGVGAWAIHRGRSLLGLAFGPVVYWLTGSPLGFGLSI